MAEIWKSINGYETLYEVSNRGRVRSVDRVFHGLHPRWGTPYTRVHKGKVLKPGIQHVGHLSIQLSINGKAQTFLVHRLVAHAFIPNPDNLPFVLHKDDDPSNNRKSNLMWGTPQDNSADMVEKGRSSFGSRNPSAKLSEDDVRNIRRLFAQGFSGKEIAKLYSMNPATISEIRRDKLWKHV